MNTSFVIVGILTGIIVCAVTNEKRWLKSALITAGIMLVLFMGDISNAPTQDRASYLVGQAIGYGLAAGSLGFLIGKLLFKPRKKVDNKKETEE